MRKDAMIPYIYIYIVDVASNMCIYTYIHLYENSYQIFHFQCGNVPGRESPNSTLSQRCCAACRTELRRVSIGGATWGEGAGGPGPPKPQLATAVARAPGAARTAMGHRRRRGAWGRPQRVSVKSVKLQRENRNARTHPKT